MSEFEFLDKSIGSAFLIDPDLFGAWAQSSGYNWAFSDDMVELLSQTMNWEAYKIKQFLDVVAQPIYTSADDHWSGRELTTLKELAEYNKRYKIPFQVSYMSDDFSVIYSIGKESRYLIPNRHLEIKMNSDYTDYTLSELKALRQSDSEEFSALKNEVSADNFRRSDIEELKKKQKQQLEKQKKLIEDIEYKRVEELAIQEAKIEKMRQELYKKQQSMLAEANKMRFELEKKVEDLNTKIFYLETEINAIEGYFGESTTFVQLRSGQKSLPEEPVVMFQKVRYLDEELGRYFSMREVEGTADTMLTFEQALSSRDDLFDLFSPNKKSISMIRISKSGYGYTNGQMESTNMLEKYKKYHGETLAILLRNGDNLWICWLDENKISFKDDLFYQNKVTEQASETKNMVKEIDWTHTRNLEERLKDAKKQKKAVRGEFASRYILFSILQGVLDNGTMMTLPEKVNVIQAINQKSPYFIASVADGWLEDTRLPSFSELIDKYSFYKETGEDRVLEAEYELNPDKFENMRDYPHKQNDDIYVLYRLRGWSPTSANYTYYNSDNRSNSESGRDLAYSIDLKDGIYQINLVKQGKFQKQMFSRTFVGVDSTTGENVYDYYYERETEYYIRGQKAYNKSDYWGDKAKRLTANFRVYESEFINLTFLNSVFIDYVITTKRIGSYSSTYASLVPMLNSMSRFLKEREKKELQYIKEIMPDFEMHEWQIALSDWKLANKVRRITPFQAKRFLRAMKFVQ
ncbi:hypothetical protein ACN6KO_16100 (plasmid) [Enterococcus faecium]|uniref:hypothetical protein n=1 Tax=Enterococcus faecium TaxID=1352 RepID=UPI003F4E8034